MSIKKQDKSKRDDPDDDDDMLDLEDERQAWNKRVDYFAKNPLGEDIEDILNALIPQAEKGDRKALQRLIGLADLRGNSRAIMPVLLVMNADIEKTLGKRSEEIDEFIIGFCLASIGYMRGGRRELLSGIGGEQVNIPVYEEEGKKRGLLSRIFGR